jgi:uncharacterized membrane protein YgcG
MQVSCQLSLSILSANHTLDNLLTIFYLLKANNQTKRPSLWRRLFKRGHREQPVAPEFSGSSNMRTSGSSVPSETSHLPNASLYTASDTTYVTPVQNQPRHPRNPAGRTSKPRTNDNYRVEYGPRTVSNRYHTTYANAATVPVASNVSSYTPSFDPGAAASASTASYSYSYSGGGGGGGGSSSGGGASYSAPAGGF